MNERLRELADQAGFIRFSPEEDPRTPIDWSSDYEHELKRFAELIVQECVRIGQETSKEIFKMSKKQGDIFEYGSHGAEQVVDNIKQHFGVE